MIFALSPLEQVMDKSINNPISEGFLNIIGITISLFLFWGLIYFIYVLFKAGFMFRKKLMNDYEINNLKAKILNGTASAEEKELFFQYLKEMDRRNQND